MSPGETRQIPEAESYWDRVAAAWPGGPSPLWRRQSDLVNRMLIERWLAEPPLERVLKTDLFDEVAGEGLLEALRSQAEEVVAVDVSARAVALASERHPEVETHVADARQLPFAAGHFDAVISNSTLDHLHARGEVATALGELARVLRRGGRLVITLDNPLNPMIALRDALPVRLARRVRRVDYDSGWTCGPRGLRRLLEESGFVVRDTTAVLHVPRALVARVRSPEEDSAWLRMLRAGERLERLPTRYLTGHFVAALAERA